MSPYGGVRLTGSLTDLDCVIEAVHAAGDHDIIIGRVIDLTLNPPNEPLVYFDRQFPALHSGTSSESWKSTSRPASTR